jgi:hypothetical protein
MAIIIEINKILEIVNKNHGKYISYNPQDEELDELLEGIRFDLENLRGNKHR